MEKQKATQKVSRITTRAYLVGNKTRITTSINPKNNMTDVSVYLVIPKCLAEHIKDIEFHDKNYEIIQDDPLIVWHFPNLDKKVDLTYEIEGQLSDECKQQIKAMAIAQDIGLELHKERSLFAALGWFLAIPIICVVLIYFSKFHKAGEIAEIPEAKPVIPEEMPKTDVKKILKPEIFHKLKKIEKKLGVAEEVTKIPRIKVPEVRKEYKREYRADKELEDIGKRISEIQNNINII